LKIKKKPIQTHCHIYFGQLVTNFFLTLKLIPLNPSAQALFLYTDRPENKRTLIFLLQTRLPLKRTTPAIVEIRLQPHLEEASGLILKHFSLPAILNIISPACEKPQPLLTTTKLYR